jgi:hypothetical protein
MGSDSGRENQYAGKCTSGKQMNTKDEAEHIAKCLYALSQQSGHSQYQVLLLLNNCTDDTAAIVRELAPSLPIPVSQLQVTLPQEHATAGFARAWLSRPRHVVSNREGSY